MLTRLRWWLHTLRPAHDSYMAEAESDVEWANYLERQYGRLDAKRDLWLHRAHMAVAACGCPPRLWRNQVREALA